MRQTIDPHVEFDWRPVLWGASVVVLFGLVVNLVFLKPAWFIPATLVGGGVAGARSGFYGQSGNNGAIAVLLGSVVLTPILTYTRIMSLGIESLGDSVFVFVGWAGAWLIIVMMILVPHGYIGGVLVDFTRRKVGGPIGY